uniref:A' protein n=1 Tax=Cacopsylla melanoneura TaxID=428564 RepID=A0A8D9EXY0_9HEMI
MPPNLGGFFMVRSYYPSECHADYFDFERIEALKPAIEACGISTLSQSPMLGFHKQMDMAAREEEEVKEGMAAQEHNLLHTVLIREADMAAREEEQEAMENETRNQKHYNKIIDQM